MEKSSSVFVAGHRGLVGSAIVRRLVQEGYDNIVVRSRSDLDLLDGHAVERFFAEARPEYVFLAAAKVGGIHANHTYPVEFLSENLKIQQNVILSAHANDTRKLLFLGSSCIYPKLAPQPIKEESLLSGPLEPTNDAYAIAKIAGIRLCQALWQEYDRHFISVMPTNLYGPGDNFDLQTSHVLPALIRRFHLAKAAGAPSVLLWGSGTPRREFLHSDDLARACVFLMQSYDSPQIINIGCGDDVTIHELALIVKDVVGYSGEIEFNSTKPDGTPRKLLDVTKIHSLGWHREIGLEQGIASVYSQADKSTW